MCYSVKKSGKRDSDPRPQPWQGCALPTELFPQKQSEEEETRTPTSQLTLPPQSSASTNSATSPTCNNMLKKRVPRTGLEPARLAAHAPETCASTNSATWALIKHQLLNLSFVSICLERKTGLGPATPTLARLCSTN